MLGWFSHPYIVHWKCAAIHNGIHNYLNLSVAFLLGQELALWQSGGQWCSSTGHSHPIKIEISYQMIHFAHSSTIY
jgi:hypothetical protein